METLVYTANCLYLAAYFMTDMLRMRLLSVVAACCLASYFYAQPEPLLTVVAWNGVFVVLNLGQIAWLLRRRWRAAAGAKHPPLTPHAATARP